MLVFSHAVFWKSTHSLNRTKKNVFTSIAFELFKEDILFDEQEHIVCIAVVYVKCKCFFGSFVCAVRSGADDMQA